MPRESMLPAPSPIPLRLLLTTTLAAVVVSAVPPARAQSAGLWIGTVAIDRVSTPQPGGGDPQPAGGIASMRLIVHVDEAGTARLLRDVIVMHRPAAGGQPARFVLVTDPARIPEFAGVTERKGRLAGLRYSSVAFEFDGPARSAPLGSGFAPGGSLSGALQLSATHPNNPFRHKFHPDHRSGFPITRTLTFDLDAAPVAAEAGRPGFGERWITGLYAETITGLHKHPIRISGTFNLTRVSDVARLNDEAPAE